MKKVLLIPPLSLPIPDVQGGAIERLITILMNQNEIYNQCNLNVISVSNEEAMKIAEKYLNSKVYFVKGINKLIQGLYNLLEIIIYKTIKYRLFVHDLRYLKVMRIINKLKPDVIVVEGDGGEQLFLSLKKYEKDKCYLHLHHEYAPNKILDDTFGTIISTSKFIGERWLERTSNSYLKNEVVLNCIETERFQKIFSEEERDKFRDKLGYKKEDFVVLYCGRILEVKGVRELILAIKKIENHNIKLVIVGSPNFALETETDYLKEIIGLIEEDKAQRIKYVGYVPNERLYQYYQSVDLQVVPSLWEEAAGLVVLEGMLSGLPLVITKSGGMGEYATKDCALQVDKDKNVVLNIKKAIEKLYNDVELRTCLFENGRERAKNFSEKQYYKDYLKAIRIYKEY